MKYFRMSYEEVVFNRSYLNILLLNRSIPSFHIDNEDEKKNGASNKIDSINHGSRRTQKYRNETELFLSLM